MISESEIRERYLKIGPASTAGRSVVKVGVPDIKQFEAYANSMANSQVERMSNHVVDTLCHIIGDYVERHTEES